MADDSDDDKDNKNNKGQKDTAYLAQFDNVVNDIKLQIRTTNPAELARLNASITSLLSSNLPPETLAKLQNLQAFVKEREEQAEQVVLSQQLAEERKAEVDRMASFLEREVKEAAKLEHFHHKSLKFEERCEDAEKYLAAKKEESSLLSDVVEDIKKDGDVDKNKLLALIKTEEQIKKENEEYNKLLKYRDKAHKYYKKVSDHNQELLTERVRLGNELTEKEKTEAPQSPTIVNTKKLITHQDEKIVAFAPVLAKATEQRDRMDATVEKVNKVHEQCNIKVKEIHKKIDESEDITPEKRKNLSLFATLFDNQQEAIVGDGIVKDTVLRGEFIEQLKNEKDVEPELQNSKTQKESPNTNKEQDSTQKTDQNKLSGDAIHQVGNKLIQGLGYHEHTVIMNQLHEIKPDQGTTKKLSSLTTGPVKPVETPINLNPGDPKKNKGIEK